MFTKDKKTLMPIKMTELACCLHLPYTPKSVTYRSYNDKLFQQTVLTWFISNFAAVYPDQHLYLLTTDDISLSTQNVDRKNRNMISAINLTQGGVIHTINEAMDIIKEPQVALFRLEAGMAPYNFIEEIYSHHIKNKCDATYVRGFPKNCCIEMYKKTYLENLCRLPLPKNINTLKAATEYISSFNNNSLLKILSKVINLKNGLKIGYVDAISLYAVNPEELPKTVEFDFPRDAEIAVQVLAQARDIDIKTNPIVYLRMWRKAAIEWRNSDKSLIQDSTIKPSHQDVVKTKTRPRLLFLTIPSAFSGAEESFYQLISNIDQQHYEIDVWVSLPGFLVDKLRSRGVRVIIGYRDLAENTVNNYLYAQKLFCEIAPDLIHFNSYPGFATLIAAENARIPTIQHLRTTDLDLYRESLHNSSAIITVSEFIRKEALLRETEDEKLRVIYNGVDLSTYKPNCFDKSSMRSEFAIPKDATVALMIARYVPNKRHDLIIKAAVQVMKQLPSFHLVLVGESLSELKYYDEVLRAINKLKLSKAVTLLGFQPDVRKIMSASDVLVSCSDREPLARCVIEAMGIGLPVIVTNSGGTPEIIENGISGIIIPSNSIESLASSITHVVSNKEIANNLAINARKYAEKHLSVNHYVKSVTAIYEKILHCGKAVGS